MQSVSIEMPSVSFAFFLQSISYAAVAFHLYEWLNNLGFEKRHFWRTRSWCLQARYFLSRYGGIGCQIAYAFLMHRLHSRRKDPSHRSCRSWYAMQLVTSQVLLLSLEWTCVARVAAFYERRKTVGWGLRGLVLAEAVIVMMSGLVSLMQIDIGNTCLVKTLGPSLALIPVTQVTVHLTILTLTVMKRDHKEVPVLGLIVRDGSWTFLAVMGLLAGCCVQMSLSAFKRINPFTYHICYPIFVAGVTTWNCRTIRNMEDLFNPEPQDEHTESTQIMLTTVIHSLAETLETEESNFSMR